MAVFETWLKSDLQKAVQVKSIQGNLFSADNAGNLIGVVITNGGSPAEITGNVTAYVIRADGATVVVEGSLSGNRASVTLPASAYAVVGQASIVIKVGTTTVGACTIYVYRSTTDTIVDPGEVIPSISELLEKIDEMEQGTAAANAAAQNANTAASKIPAGGATGAVLRKQSGTDYDYSWDDTILPGIQTDVNDLKSALNGIGNALETYKIKNLLNPDVLASIKYANYDVYTVTGDSVAVNLTDSNETSSSSRIVALGAGTYTVSTQNACRIQVYVDGSKVADQYGSTSVSFTLTQSSNVYFKFMSPSSYPYTIGTIQVEVGSAKTAYVPFSEPVFYSTVQAKINNVIASDRTAYSVFGRVSGEIANQGTVAEGVLRYTDNTIVAVGYHSTLSVNAGDELYFEGYCYNSAFPVVTFLYGGAILNTVYKKSGHYYGNIIVPPYVDAVVVNGDTSSVCVAKVSNSGADNEGYPLKQYVDLSIKGNTVPSSLKGKDIVWFGTSIPAGGFIGADVTRNYPAYIANKYGCTIHNEAIGSSCAHCKELNLISSDNPYGLNPNYTLSSRCLSNTQEEMQWMIDHYNDSFWTSKPTLTDLYKSQMLSFSYESKLDKYLTEEAFPDLFIFDHGYNDYVSTVDNYTGHEYEPYTLQGALNFLIRRIYSYNPEAKIIIIGNYKYQTRNGLVVQAQEAVAQRWDIPIYDNWHYTGLSDEQVYTDFTWVRNGNTWEKQTGTSHLETLTNVLLPDGVHPHSRPDDLIINRMANAIGEWLAVNATFDN